MRGGDACQLRQMRENIQKTELRRPSLYHVVMHNNDFTTMEFVVEMLITILTREGRKLRL